MFLLTLVVIDDLVALLIIALAYTDDVSMRALAIAVALFGVLIALRWAGSWRGPAAVLVGVGIWLALLQVRRRPGRSPGLAIGLVTSAYPPARDDLERSTELTRSFREQPTPELAYSARAGLVSAISPNERLQYRLHPWTSRVIVPLFALANAGIHINGGLLSDAVTSPVTLGIVAAYVIGKPLGIMGAAWLATPADVRRRAPDGDVPRAGRRRRRGRRAVHRLAADRDARLRRRAARPGEDRRARRGTARAADGVARDRG